MVSMAVMNQLERQTFQSPDTLVPELAMIGWSRFARASPGHLSAHTHADSYELCLIVQGTVDWWAGDEVWEVGPGQMYITFPGETHGGIGTIMNPCTLYWAQLRCNKTAALPGLNRRQTMELKKWLSALHPRRFTAQPGVQPMFAQLLHEHVSPSSLSPMLVRALLHQLLVLTLRSHQAQQQEDVQRRGRYSPKVTRAIELIDADKDCRWKVNGLAQTVGLSAARFRLHFHRQVGMSPREYLLRKKMLATKALLRQGQSVTRVAMRLGFASSQHLATRFRHHCGMTPRQYVQSWQTAEKLMDQA